jgi:outer membrane protein TolC
MRMPWHILFRAAVTMIFCHVIVLASCRHLPDPRTSSFQAIGVSLRSALVDPFRSVDNEQFTNTNSANVLINNRAKPATVALGKRQLPLEDCRRLALANNLDLQVARLDEFTKRAVAYSNETKLLPHFMFSGDLSDRDNPPYSYSDVLGQEGRTPSPSEAGTGVTNFSTGHERSTWRYVLETRWSPTDAGLAYYLTKSSKNERLKSHYQRMRVAQKLIGLVDAAYFRLLCLQECVPLAEQHAAIRSDVSEKMRKLLDKKLVPVEEYNRAKQQEVKARRQLTRMANQVEKQRNILASAIGLSPDYCVDGGFRVTGELIVPAFSGQLCDMELTAVQNRPEAFEAGLNHLNSVNDLKRTIIKYFPKVSGFWRMTRDKDKYLYNKDWKEVGMSVYFDLADWYSNLSESSAARFGSAKTHREMGTVALGITSQVRMSALQYYDAMDELRSAEEALRGTREVFSVAQRRSLKEDLDKIAVQEAQANMVQDMLERAKAMGEANAVFGELQGVMGTNYKEPRPSD